MEYNGENGGEDENAGGSDEDEAEFEAEFEDEEGKEGFEG